MISIVFYFDYNLLSPLQQLKLSGVGANVVRASGAIFGVLAAFALLFVQTVMLLTRRDPENKRRSFWFKLISPHLTKVRSLIKRGHHQTTMISMVPKLRTMGIQLTTIRLFSSIVLTRLQGSTETLVY